MLVSMNNDVHGGKWFINGLSTINGHLMVINGAKWANNNEQCGGIAIKYSGNSYSLIV